MNGTQDYVRDVHHHLIRIGGRLDAIRDTVSTAIQVNLSMVPIVKSEVNKRMAAWARSLPFYRVRWSLGMNFTYMPEMEWKWSYPTVLTIMVAV